MESSVIVIGMAATTTISAVVQMVLRALGKRDETILLDFTTKCLIVTTATATFGTFLKALTTII